MRPKAVELVGSIRSTLLDVPRTRPISSSRTTSNRPATWPLPFVHLDESCGGVGRTTGRRPRPFPLGPVGRRPRCTPLDSTDGRWSLGESPHESPQDPGKVESCKPSLPMALSALLGPSWLRQRRGEAFQAYSGMPLPSEKEEVWRYSPIDDLDLDTYRPATNSGGALGAQAEELVASWRGEMAPSRRPSDRSQRDASVDSGRPFGCRRRQGALGLQ